jgi:pimeloyl-ACP methyl ester carboxylesterase
VHRHGTTVPAGVDNADFTWTGPEGTLQGGCMAGFVLVHGAGDSAWYWHRVVPQLERAGHDVRAPEAPEGESTLAAWEDAVVAAGESLPRPLAVVAQSFGAFAATLAAVRLPADLLVLVAGMVPQRGESPDDWWAGTAYAESGAPGGLDTGATFYHDVDPEVADEAMRRGRDGVLTDLDRPWPLDTHTGIPTRVIVGTEDRFFPPHWLEQVVRGRLDVVPDEVEAGHCMALSRPRELVELLESYLPT